MEYILMLIACVFVNNIILSQFLGICPFLGVSNKLSTALGMGVAVIFVMTLATLVTSLVYAVEKIAYHLPRPRRRERRIVRRRVEPHETVSPEREKAQHPAVYAAAHRPLLP